MAGGSVDGCNIEARVEGLLTRVGTTATHDWPGELILAEGSEEQKAAELGRMDLRDMSSH